MKIPSRWSDDYSADRAKERLMSSKLFRAAILATMLAGSTAALAGNTQTHHCKMPDGSMDMKKTHKQCTAAKGTWAKDAPASKDAPKTGSAPAPK
jgi:hypothetical protein